jgi:hypothetical protein
MSGLGRLRGGVRELYDLSVFLEFVIGLADILGQLLLFLRDEHVQYGSQLLVLIDRLLGQSLSLLHVSQLDLSQTSFVLLDESLGSLQELIKLVLLVLLGRTSGLFLAVITRSFIRRGQYALERCLLYFLLA